MLYSINGVVIPGGSATLQPGNGFYDAFATIYEIAKKVSWYYFWKDFFNIYCQNVIKIVSIFS